MSDAKDILKELEEFYEAALGKEGQRIIRAMLRKVIVDAVSEKWDLNRELVNILWNVVARAVKFVDEKDYMDSKEKYRWVDRVAKRFAKSRGVLKRIGNADIRLMIEGAYGIEVRFHF